MGFTCRGAGILTLIVGALLGWTRPEEGTGFIHVEIERPSAWPAFEGREWKAISTPIAINVSEGRGLMAPLPSSWPLWPGPSAW